MKRFVYVYFYVTFGKSEDPFVIFYPLHRKASKTTQIINNNLKFNFSPKTNEKSRLKGHINVIKGTI